MKIKKEIPSEILRRNDNRAVHGCMAGLHLAVKRVLIEFPVLAHRLRFYKSKRYNISLKFYA
jgi:uncharacterized protein (DUF1330 family)